MCAASSLKASSLKAKINKLINKLRKNGKNN
jgi:hypothetical protein